MERGNVDVRAQKAGIFGDPCVEIGMFDRLHQSEMTFGQLQVPAPRQRAEHAEADCVHAASCEAFVAGAGDSVQDYPGDVHAGVVAAETQGGRGGGLRLA